MSSATVLDGDILKYTIEKTWNDLSPFDNAKIHLKFSKPKEDEEKGLVLSIDAPLYKDPIVPSSIPIGSVDKLWEYEVVEVFLLGDDDKYLEIELAPSGHYLLLLLHGTRNIIQQHLPLNSIRVEEYKGRWSANVIIPHNYLPININRFNAYAIHKQDPHRQYLALFPTPSNKFEQPDFHRLDYFQPIDLSNLIKTN